MKNHGSNSVKIRSDETQMNRPYTICHVLSSLNGKISGSFMGTEAAQAIVQEYAKLRKGFGADAWLYGTTTTKEFTGNRKPDSPVKTQQVPTGDYVAGTSASLYYVSVDTGGEICWDSGIFLAGGKEKAHVIEILTERTLMIYRAYLRARNVSYIIAGTDSLDCKLASEKLYQLFGIRILAVCGGGIVNWSFLQAGVVDELSLILAPAADGEKEGASVFERSDLIPFSMPAEFKLEEVGRIKENGIWLRYSVEKANYDN